jgi:hypothetical protein
VEEIVNEVLLKVRSAVGSRVSPSIETVSPDLIKKVSAAVTVNWAFVTMAARSNAVVMAYLIIVESWGDY